MATPKSKPNNLIRLLTYTRPYRKRLIWSILLAIILAGIAPLRPYLIQLSIDDYITNGLLQLLINITIVQFGILLIETLLRFVFIYFSGWLGQTVVMDLRQTVFKKIIYQNLKFFDHTPIGTLTTRTINDLEAVSDVFSEGLLSIIADILAIIIIITIMCFTDWRLTLVSLVVLPVLIFATYIFKESVKKSFQNVRNYVAQLNAFVQEHITGMYIIQAFGVEEREKNKFELINKNHRSAHIKSILAYSVFFPVVEIVLATSLGLLVWYGAAQMMDAKVSQGVIIAFIMYINLLFRPLRMLADKFNTLQMGMVASDRVFTLLDNESFENDGGTIKNVSIKGKVSFENVVFGYNESQTVLNDISFIGNPGETIALVGHTGAGKSSIISILNRLYPIQSGKILIDDTPIDSFDLQFLRKSIGIVLQDVFLFSGSIYDNITLNNNEISTKQVEDVCKLLGIHDFIMRLPENYNFDIGERGNSLSQGQKQLISFARALIYNPAILILDEATSSVDSESEILIQHAIDTMIKGRTSIVIAHRLSTIRKANNIIVLEKGEIAEQGSHEYLIELKGKYYEMYHSKIAVKLL